MVFSQVTHYLYIPREKVVFLSVNCIFLLLSFVCLHNVARFAPCTQKPIAWRAGILYFFDKKLLSLKIT